MTALVMWLWFQGKDTIRKLWNLPVQLRNVAEAGHMSGNALYGGLEETLYKALKVIHVLLQRPQDVGEARAVDYLPRKAAECLGTRARERSVLQLTQLKGVGDRKCFDIRHGNREFEICLSGFQTHFSPALPYYAPFAPFSNSYVCPVLLYLRNITTCV